VEGEGCSEGGFKYEKGKGEKHGHIKQTGKALD